MHTPNMPTTHFVDNLLTPLLARAHAYRQSPSMAFKDKAAELLVEKLELNECRLFTQGPSEIEQSIALSRCVWIDQCVLRFLERYPRAVGINLSCGLNTRFHRLSQQLDWPQFRWADVDTEETIAFNQGLLPNIDNYRAIGCDYWQDDWLTKSGWKPGTPIIIIMEKLAFTASKEQLIAFGENIKKIYLMDKDACVHIVLDYPSNRKGLLSKPSTSECPITPILDTINIHTNTVRTQNISRKISSQQSWLSRFLMGTTDWKGVQLSCSRRQ